MRTLKNILLGTVICLVSNVVAHAQSSQKSWTSVGPRNIAGRILAVHVDVANSQKIYAGTAGGGLWISTNNGQSWSRCVSLDGSPAISAITQSSNGDIYVGTGEGMNMGYYDPGVVANNYPYGIKGDGVYKSTDNGVTFVRLPNTDIWTDVNAIAYDNVNGRLYAATNDGLKVSSDGGATFVAANGTSTGVRGVSLKVSNGTVIYAEMGNVYVSANGGAFASVAGSALPKLPISGTGRISVDISPSYPNMMYALLSNMDGTFAGTYLSNNSGKDWRLIFPAGSQQLDPMSNFGSFCNTIAVCPMDTTRVLVGGLYLYDGIGKGTGMNFYGWKHISGTSFIHSIYYVDSTKAYLGTNQGVVIATISGTSVSVAESNNNLISLQPYTLGVSNEGRLMMGTRDNGMILMENPGMPAKSGKDLPITYPSKRTASDGADCLFSMIKSDALFYTSSYGYCCRQASISSPAQLPSQWLGGSSLDQSSAGKYFLINILNKRGNEKTDEDKYTRWHYSSISTVPNNSGLSFLYANTNVSPLAFWESVNDQNSIDSVDFVADKTYVTGDEICVKSKRNGYPIWMKYTGTDTLRRENADKWRVKDVVTSRFFIGGSGYKAAMAGAPVFMTTDALDFVNSSRFVCVFRTKDTTEQVMKMLPSKDGDHLFILTQKHVATNLYYNYIYRVSGFDQYRAFEEMEVSHNISDSTKGFSADNPNRKLEDNTLIADFLYEILDIALDPQDNNTLLFTTSDNGQRINAITDALTAFGGEANVVVKEGTGLPATAAVYCAIVEMSNSDIAYIGTEEGVYRTENFTDSDPTWKLYNIGINAKVPVFKLYQQTNYVSNAHSVRYTAKGAAEYTYFQGVTNYRMIYAVTHGMGIFVDSSYWDNIPNIPFPNPTSNSVNLHIFPNPAANSITLDFTIAAASDIQISISDVTGKTVLTQSLGARMLGKHQENIDCSALSEGFYFVTVHAGNQNQSAKIIIRK